MHPKNKLQLALEELREEMALLCEQHAIFYEQQSSTVPRKMAQRYAERASEARMIAAKIRKMAIGDQSQETLDNQE